MTVLITTLVFTARLEGTRAEKPESESSEREKAAERARLVSRAVTETMAVVRRREER